jgi:hypothetical protein
LWTAIIRSFLATKMTGWPGGGKSCSRSGVLSPGEIAEDPQARENSLFAEVDVGGHSFRIVAAPAQLDE